jgi:ceramide glucosyltransferase
MIFDILLLILAISAIYSIVALIAAHQAVGVDYYTTISRQRLPSVSILKPLKGVDDDLEANLHTFFQQDYPYYEIIFGIKDPDDPAIEVARKVRSFYPEVASRIILQDHNEGLNPKVANLITMAKVAQKKYFLISDSNVRVEADYLFTMMINVLRPGVGLVTSAIRGTGGGRLGAIMENLHLNTYIAMSVIAIPRLVGRHITVGKSMLFSREILDKIGGFAYFRNYLAEDQMLGDKIRAAGYKVSLVAKPVETVNRSWRLREVLNRHTRWAKMRRHFSLRDYLFEILSMPIVLAVIAAFFAPTVTIGVTLVAAVGVGKMISDYIFAVKFAPRMPRWHFALIPVKEILLFFFWMWGLLSNTIDWRGNRMRIGKNTRLYPLDKNMSESVSKTSAA